MSNLTAYSPKLIAHLKSVEPFWIDASYFLALISENALSPRLAEELMQLLQGHLDALTSWEMNEKMQQITVMLSEMKLKEKAEKEAYTWEFFF